MKLNRREKKLIATTTAIITLWLLYAFVMAPARARIKTLNRVIPDKIEQYQKLTQLAHRYQQVSSKIAEIKQKISSEPATFELLPFVEQTIEKCKLSNNRTTMTQQNQPLNDNYTQTIVSLKLNGITLRQIVGFLTQLTSHRPYITIKSLQLKKNATSPDTLNAYIQIATITTLTTAI